MSVRFFMLLLVLPAAGALAQSVDDSSVTVVVPVVGSVTGVNGVHWKTDVELRNDTGKEATVALTLPAAPDAPSLIFTLAPGEGKSFADVVGQAFGMDRGMSPLSIQTSGRRSVTVLTTAYGVREGEAFKPEPIPAVWANAYFPSRFLSGLSFGDQFRTNIGIVNAGEHSATFVLALQRLEGRNLAVARVTLPAGTMWQAPIQTFFPLISSGDDFSVLVECGSLDTYVYASVIENESNSATFVQPRIGVP